MIIPIVTAAIFLGRAFDYNSMTDKNVYIYDTNSVEENKLGINRTLTKSQYRIMQYSSDASDFLDVDGELSLKAKKGQIELKGYGDYMMKTIDREKTVEILISVYHETVTETFPTYSTLRTDWQDLPSEQVGSHYVRSITYGGQLIITYLLKANSTEYMEEIKASASANLAFSGSFDGSIKGNVHKLLKEVEGKTSIEINVFATAGAISAPTNLEQVFQLVEDYPGLVSKLNEGKGSPLKLEIVSLNTLSPSHAAFRKNYALDALLSEALNKYDDVRVSKDNFQKWPQPLILNKTEADMYNDYINKLNDASKEFENAITNLRGDGGLDQFDVAFKAYGTGADNIPNRFARDLTRLKHIIEKNDFQWFPFTKAVSHYIHWGSLNCTLPSPGPVYVGLAATGPKGYGNGGSIECLTVIPSPELENSILTRDTILSNINGVYTNLTNGDVVPVLCAFCRLENATAAVTIPGRTSCPDETKLEYSGVWMTSQDSGMSSNFVCMENKPDVRLPNVVIVGSYDDAAPLVPVVSEFDGNDKKKLIPCVVCSR